MISFLKKIKLIKLIILSLVILVVVVIYLFWQNNNKLKTGSERMIFNKQWQNPITKDIVSKIQQFKDLKVYSQDSDYLLWKKDGYLVYIPTRDSINIDYCDLKENKPVYNLKEFLKSSPLGLVRDEVSKVLIDRGYFFDKSNSIETGDYYLIKGYEKGGILCSIDIFDVLSQCGLGNNSNEISMSIKCASNLDKFFSKEKEYIDILLSINAIKNKGIAISEIKQKDNFLRIGVTDGTTGAVFILRQEKNKYLLIDGPLQEDPQCRKMNEQKVPKDIYYNCYDAD